MAAARTLGIEEELQIVDAETLELAFRAPELLSQLSAESYSAELQRSTVETNTKVFSTLNGLGLELLGLRKGVIEAADAQGLAVAAAGTAPLSSAADLELTALGRYARMQQDYRLLVDEHLVCGLQVHVGVDDADLAVRLIPRIEDTLPILLALSASSPFFEGQDTGYASVRTVIWQRWPTAGRTPRVESYEEYQSLLGNLITAGIISDNNMAYFDVRPSAHLPTLELRVCDSTPLVDDAILIAGLFRAAVERAARQEVAGLPRPHRPDPPVPGGHVASGPKRTRRDLARYRQRAPGPAGRRGRATSGSGSSTRARRRRRLGRRARTDGGRAGSGKLMRTPTRPVCGTGARR